MSDRQFSYPRETYEILYSPKQDLRNDRNEFLIIFHILIKPYSTGRALRRLQVFKDVHRGGRRLCISSAQGYILTLMLLYVLMCPLFSRMSSVFRKVGIVITSPPRATRRPFADTPAQISCENSKCTDRCVHNGR